MNSAVDFSEALFNFVSKWKSANFRLRENNFTVDYYVKLATFARFYLDFFTEAGSQ